MNVETRDALRMRVLRAVDAERTAQDHRWGVQDHDPDRWLAILAEEVGEAAKMCNEDPAANANPRLYKEVVQVAAVAVAWAERIQGRIAGNTV